jgi:drug/metabolite transporter (DMT)-like permease
MPATAFGYVVVALLSRFWLHEHLSPYRWAGIALIVCAVGFVAGGPSRTEHPDPEHPDPEHPSSHPDLDLMDSGAGR